MIVLGWIISFEKKGRKMVVKNVIKGLLRKYDLQEISIISQAESKVYFSGTVDQWNATAECLVPLKKQVEETEVLERIMFNGIKAFVCIAPLDCFYPQEGD